MPKLISKTELDKKQTNSIKKDTYYVGEIYPEIFNSDSDHNLKTTKKLDAAIIWLGSYCIDNRTIPKIRCPACNRKESLIPYICGGSILSGIHIIKYICQNCGEKFVTNDNIESFKLIYKYILDNKNNLEKSKLFKYCSTSPQNARFVADNKDMNTKYKEV